MARIKWVVATLREWAAWIDAPVVIRGIDYSGVRIDKCAGNWLPADTVSVRRTQSVISKLSAEHQETLCLVYIEGPRANRVSIAKIAEWKGVHRVTLYKRLHDAETAFAREFDWKPIKEGEKEGDKG